MADLSGLGDLVLTVGGDISPFEAAIQDIPAVAQQAASQIQAAFDAIPSATQEVESSLASLSEGMANAGQEAAAAGGNINQMPPALHDTAEASNEAGEALKEFIEQGLELAGIALTLEALKEAILGSLEAFGELQVATEAMTAMTQNAEGVKTALEGIPELANEIGVSIGALESAFTKFTRYGIDLQQIPVALSAIADAAKGSGISFDTAVSAWERAVNTGNVTAKTVQNMGVSLDTLATVMGMTGAPAAEVTKQFKAIQDSSDGTSAATQRLNDLMAAIPPQFRGLAASNDDVQKSFTQMSNVITEAKETIGSAIAALSTAGGMDVFKIAVDVVVVAFVGLVNIVAEFKDAAVGAFKIIYDASASLAAAIGDMLSGNWKKALADLQTGGQQITAAWMQMGQNMAADFIKTGAIVDGVATDIGKSLDHMAAGAADASDKIVRPLNDVEQQAKATSQALTNAQNAFDKVAAAYAAGAAGPVAYTKALDALNAAQEEANGGFEQAATAVALAANAYVDLLIKATNAQTTLEAVLADMAKGTASATQYSAALIALNKAQEELNNGYENAHTALLLAIDDFSKLQVQTANAATTLNAVATALLNGQSSLTQLDQALQAFNRDQMNANGGLQEFSTVVDMVGVTMQKLTVSLANSQMSLQAWLDKLAAGYPVVQNVIDALNGEVTAFEKAHGGALDLASAENALTAEHMKLQLAADNANTTLSAAYALYDKGTINANELATAINNAAKANDALSGSHSKVASAANSAATAQQNLNAALHGGVTESLNNVNVENDYATSLAVVEGKLVQLGVAYGDTVKSATDMATQAVAGTTDFATALESVNGQLQAIPGTATAAAAGIASVATAAGNAASAISSMASSLDAFMGDAGGGSLGSQLDRSMSAPIGGFGVSLQPGQLFTEPFVGNPSHAGTEVGSMLGGGLFGPTMPGETQLFGTPDQIIAYGQQLQQQIQAMNQAGQTLTTAGTALNTAATAQQTAAQTAYDAAKAATIAANQTSMAAQSIQTTNDAISASSLNAATLSSDALVGTAAILSAAGNTVTTAATTLVSAGTSLVTAGNTLTTAVQQATAPISGSTAFTPNMPAVGALPNVGPSGATSFSPANWTPGYSPTVGGTGPTITVNGSNFVQQLFNDFFNQLQSQGYVLRRK